MYRPQFLTDRRVLLALFAAAVAASLAGCVGPDTNYRSFEFVDGADPGNELPEDMEVNGSRDYLVVNIDSFGHDLNGRVNFTGRYYRLTDRDGETVAFSMEDVYRNDSLGLEPSANASVFEERVRSRGDVESLEVVEVNRSKELFLAEGDSEVIIEVHPRTLAGRYEGRLWKGRMTDIPIDKFNFTITPKRASGLRR